MLDPVSVIAAGAAAGGLGLKISQPLLKHHLSGHFLTLQGGQYMDRTIDILSDEDLSAGILPKAKQRYLELHERSDSKQSDTQHHFDAHENVSLQPTRQSLEKTTDSVTGSIRHCFKAKTFHSNAKSLFQKTKVSHVVMEQSFLLSVLTYVLIFSRLPTQLVSGNNSKS